MRKRRSKFKRALEKIKNWIGNIAYNFYRNFHTSKKFLNVVIITVLTAASLLVIVFIPSIRNIWPDFFGALTNSLVGILLGSLYFILIVIFEDQHKVIQDIEKLKRHYGNNYNIAFRLKQTGDLFNFIYFEEPISDIKQINFITLNEEYQLPDFISNNFLELFSAHRGSFKMNSSMVRLNKYEIKDNILYLYVQKSTFYNHLVTNRAVDLPINKSVSLRELYEPGPFLNNLENNVFSNHIGVIGFVVSKEGDIILFHRSNTATTSKNKLTSTLAFGLKAPFYKATNPKDDLITNEEFEDNIYHNLYNSTGLRKDDLLDINYIGIGRDVHEGGKPQLFMTIKTKLSNEEIIQNYQNYLKSSGAYFKDCKNQYKKILREHKNLIKKLTSNIENHNDLNHFEEVILNEATSKYNQSLLKEKGLMLDSTQGFYIVNPDNIGFEGTSLIIEGLNNKGKSISKILKAESSMMMCLYYYYKKSQNKPD